MPMLARWPQGRRTTRLTTLLGCLLLALATSTACSRKSAPTPEQAPAGGAALGVGPHGAALPAVCEEYRRKLLACMESESFPKDARAGQRLALDQMLAIVREDLRQQRDSGQGTAAAAANCQDSLTTMAESGKQSCPGVF